MTVSRGLALLDESVLDAPSGTSHITATNTKIDCAIQGRRAVAAMPAR